MSACGRRREKLEKPKIRADRPMTHSDAGGLSTVMALLASSDPKSQAFASWVADFTAAA